MQGVIGWRKRVRRSGLQGKLETQLQGEEGQQGLDTEPGTAAVCPWGSRASTGRAGDVAKHRSILQGICSITWYLEPLSLLWPGLLLVVSAGVRQNHRCFCITIPPVLIPPCIPRWQIWRHFSVFPRLAHVSRLVPGTADSWWSTRQLLLSQTTV